MVKAKISFEDKLHQHQLDLVREKVSTLQVNMGKLCNQACHHCHVEAGPKRTEIMTLEVVDKILDLLENSKAVELVDITGGAPELNPNFRYFVENIRAMGKEVIDRCNLTVLFEKGQEDTAGFLCDNKVQVISSLPCYSRKNVDLQRGRGVFGKSIRALTLLNDLGYGKEGSGLQLHLVYNPVGAYLPPAQGQLEQDYKTRLEDDLGIEFNRLFTITNMPIKRFAHALERDGKLDEYMQLLLDNFNAAAVQNVMCRELVSIGWDGQIYDCDFNQMLEIPVGYRHTTIWDIQTFDELKGAIALGDHCYGCTAGAGSSCGGALV